MLPEDNCFDGDFGRKRKNSLLSSSRNKSAKRTVTTIAASGPQSESPGVLVLQVAEPLGGDERDDADDGVAYGEDTPQHADRLGIADVIGRVHVRGLDVLDFRPHSDNRPSISRQRELGVPTAGASFNSDSSSRSRSSITSTSRNPGTTARRPRD